MTELHTYDEVKALQDEITTLRAENKALRQMFSYKECLRREEELTALKAREVKMRKALEWYAAPHRPEDYLNDNGDVAACVLSCIASQSTTPPTDGGKQ